MSAASPSFTGSACSKTGRILLPVAAKSPARRRFGEPQAPGRALSPSDVLQWLERMLTGGVAISSVGISGPGDPLCDPAPVLETLAAVHAAHPELSLSLSTLGLCPPEISITELAADLAKLGLSRVSLLVDAVDPAIVEKLYAWIRPGRRTVPLDQAAVILVDAQAQAIRAFREAGLHVTVAMTVYAGVNDHHVEDVASITASLGADMLALVPFQAPKAPVSEPAPAASCAPSSCEPAACASCGSAKGCGSKAPAAPATVDEPEIPGLPELDPARLEELRQAASRYIALTPAGDPCAQDVTWAESLGEGDTDATLHLNNPAVPKPAPGKPNVAVASSDGLEVDLHLGQAIRFLVYGPRPGDGLPSLIGMRDAPEPGVEGGGDARWKALAEVLSDCFAVLASSVGQNPRKALAAQGITVLTTEADVQGAVDVLYGGGKKQKRRVKAD